MAKSSKKYEGAIILGVPRSGTTLLRKLINAHSKFTCPPETHLFSSCARFLQHEKTTEDLEIGVLGGLHYAGFSDDEILRRIKELVYGFHRDHAKSVKKERWVEKTAFDIFHLDTIDTVFGSELQFIFIVRHGLDVVCSLDEFCHKTGRHLGPLKKYLECHPNALEAYAHSWVDMNQAISHFMRKHPKNSHLLKYEDLVKEPESSMEKLLQFLGADYEKSIIDKAMIHNEEIGFADWKIYTKNTIDSESIGKWKNLSKVTQNNLGKIINPTLEQFGYKAIPLSKSTGKSDPKRYYQIGLMSQSKKRKGE